MPGVPITPVVHPCPLEMAALVNYIRILRILATRSGLLYTHARSIVCSSLYSTTTPHRVSRLAFQCLDDHLSCASGDTIAP